jgi:hypothetical protein
MSFTRFHDDPCRIVKQNQQMTDQGRYHLNVPGIGPKPCYMKDPQIISQKWAGNVWSDFTDVQSNLRGLNTPINKRDCINENTYGLNKNNNNLGGKNKEIEMKPQEFPGCSTLTTEQSRVTNPAYLYKDLEQVDWYYLPMDPQENIFLPFQHNLNTRVLEKDYFKRTDDCILKQYGGQVPTQFSKPNYVGGPNTCTSSRSCSKL